MPYVLTTTDPGLPAAWPIGFDVLAWERDGTNGFPEAIWIITHEDDPALVGECQARQITLDEHESAGTWDGSNVVVSIRGADIVALRAKVVELQTGLIGVAPALRGTLQSVASGIDGLLPANPRAAALTAR